MDSITADQVYRWLLDNRVSVSTAEAKSEYYADTATIRAGLSEDDHLVIRMPLQKKFKHPSTIRIYAPWRNDDDDTNRTPDD